MELPDRRSVLLGTSIILAMMGTAMAASLEDLVDKARPLLVFEGPGGEPEVVRQRQSLRRIAPALKERDIVVTYHEEDFPLRARFKVKPGQFMVVLIGKDGAEKARWDEPVEPQVILDLVDTMPLRKQEMKQ